MTITFQQSDILTTNSFVNINTIKYSSAHAFPTLFIPTYIQYNSEWKWVILCDITGFNYRRDKPVLINKWYNFIIWRSDSAPASHSAFSLVLYNNKIRNNLQQ